MSSSTNPNTITAQEPKTPSKGLTQAYVLRDVAYQLAVRCSVKPSALSEEEVEQARAVTNLVKAWAEADDRIRIHRGKPLPGSLRPVAKKPKRKPKFSDDPVVPNIPLASTSTVPPVEQPPTKPLVAQPVPSTSTVPQKEQAQPQPKA